MQGNHSRALYTSWDLYLISTRLGSSSLCVSKVILGTALYGSSKFQAFLLEDEEALPLLEYAWHNGIRTWDTVSLAIFSI